MMAKFFFALFVMAAVVSIIAAHQDYKPDTIDGTVFNGHEGIAGHILRNLFQPQNQDVARYGEASRS